MSQLVAEWAKHPLTKLMFKQLDLNKAEIEKELFERVVNAKAMDRVDLHRCSELKGYLHSIEDLQNIQDFFDKELLETLEGN